MTSPEHVLTVLGTRPQYVKALPVSAAFAAVGVREVVVDTGQHYDGMMADGFRDGLGLRKPDYLLGIGSDTHGRQTARMLEAIEAVIEQERPAMVVVFGDTNSTVAAALAASKMNVPVAHVEAGLRSFNRRMPEEINRIIVDHLSSLLLAPTNTAVTNLAREGISDGVHLSGDVMYDALQRVTPQLEAAWEELRCRYELEPDGFILATVHRPENTDNPVRWNGILQGFTAVASQVAPVLWPVHPRTQALLNGAELPGVRLIQPLPYVTLQAAARNARAVLTDSGGLQKEAAFHAIPCITLREETEWVELLEVSANCLAGADPRRILEATRQARRLPLAALASIFGEGQAAERIARIIKTYVSDTRSSRTCVQNPTCL